MQVDYLIIGQGICGTMLSYYLQQAGKTVLVIDEARPFTASKVASGVINPVTGRRIVRTWMIEELMPFAVQAYTEMGHQLQASLVTQCNILDFHPTPQMQLAFEERMPEESEYLRIPGNKEQWRQYFNYPFSIGEIDPCWLIDLRTLLSRWRQHLQQQEALWEDAFDHTQLVLDTPGNSIRYKHINAQKILFCDGARGANNPYFNLLPYARNKGQALIVDIKGLPRQNIYKQGITIVPWQEDLFWVGSSYEWDYTDDQPSEEFRRKTEAQLQAWLKLPFQTIEHIASERPANMERRPFAGIHPIHTTVGILNGMGTKGCSLSPYFAHQLTQYLVNGTPINPTADVQRFRKILSRN